MALIMGDTPGELSRNSLIDQQSRDEMFLNAVDRARRAYEWSNLSAADRERGRQFNADLGLRGNELAVRREIGLAPWDRGATPHQKATLDLQRELATLPWTRGMTPSEAAQVGLELTRQNAFAEATKEQNQRLRDATEGNLLLGIAQLGERERATARPYDQMTKAEQAQIDLIKAQGGLNPQRRSELLAVANQANTLFRSEAAAVIPQLADVMDGWFTSRNEAERLASKIVSGQPLLPDEAAHSDVQRALSLWNNQIEPSIRGKVSQTLGQAGGFVRNVPFGYESAIRIDAPPVSLGQTNQLTSPQLEPPVQPSPELPAGPEPTKRWVFNPQTGSIVQLAGPRPTAPSVAPSVQPPTNSLPVVQPPRLPQQTNSLIDSYGVGMPSGIAAERDAFTKQLMSSSDMRRRFMDVLGRYTGLSTTGSRIGGSTAFSMRQPYQSVEQNADAYDRIFNSLPESEQLEIIRQTTSLGPLVRPRFSFEFRPGQTNNLISE